MVVTRGVLTDTRLCAGFVAVLDKDMAGLITYQFTDDACEITSLNSLREGLEIGSALIQAAEGTARQAGCKRLWLVTTNDNAHAIRFYQRRGFTRKAVHMGALEESRKLKPGIPLVGMDEIPLLHEVEFEKVL